MKTLLWLLFAACIGIWSYNLGTMYPALQYDLQDAKSVCDKAHNEYNGTSERLCGDLQDKTGTEYLCNKDASYCWLEVK